MSALVTVRGQWELCLALTPVPGPSCMCWGRIIFTVILGLHLQPWILGASGDALA